MCRGDIDWVGAGGFYMYRVWHKCVVLGPGVVAYIWLCIVWKMINVCWDSEVSLLEI